MKNIAKLSAAAMARGLVAGDFSSVELTQAHLDRITECEEHVGAFLHTSAEEALTTARQVDAKRSAGEALAPLAGVPIALKDLVVTRGQPTTAGSKMLEGWMSPYDATVVKKIRQAEMPIVGKTNLDEFAMGSSTEHSAYGLTRNPWDLEKIPGGSGGGSAAAVAAYEVPLALGTDTGGSIRQPGAVTGTVGVKPTYGGVSRYGVIAMASSLDQVGPVSRTVLDAALLHEVIGGVDPHDATSLNREWGDLVSSVRQGAERMSMSGMRIGVVRELSGEGYQDGVLARFEKSLAVFREAGAEIVEVSCPSFVYALSAYYLIMPAEASSNLAKFDGVRFGMRVLPSDGSITMERVMSATRAAGFGDEVKRRIILGTYALSAGSYEAYYGAAQKVRTLIQRDFRAAFEDVGVDVLLSPTTPTTAFPFGAKSRDPLAMYLNDVATIPANLAGVPAMSIPNGLAREDSMPSGLQIVAPFGADALMYRFAGAAEALQHDRWGAEMMSCFSRLNDQIAGKHK